MFFFIYLANEKGAGEGGNRSAGKEEGVPVHGAQGTAQGVALPMYLG